MKKASLLGLSLLVALGAAAQADVVKEVEHNLKGSSPDYKAASSQIKAALQNPETKDQVITWYLAGKAGFGLYDQLYLQETLGNSLSAADKKDAGHALIDGFNYYFQALPLDSLPDAKGKVKPKYSKEMLKTIKENYLPLKNAGVYLFEAQDFDGAYDAWELYATLPDNPLLGKEAPVAEPDTLVGQIMYYQGLAALSVNQDQKALNKMKQVLDKGYKNIDVYRYAVEAARRLNDSIELVNLAQQGYDAFGTEDISFIGQLINAKLNGNEYESAMKLVNEAIAASDPEDKANLSQLYDILGFIYEREDDNVNAAASFRKAIEIDPNLAKGYYDLGRVIYNDAVKLDEASEGAESPEVSSKLLEAAKLFETAYDMDEDNMDAIPGILYRLYYRLGAGYEDKAEYWQKR
ncbi:MAG: hypothetical protein LIO90_08530 [Bacteroidales bacterium]|nr:hypothetical protein [Bacteroidales bacterium]